MKHFTTTALVLILFLLVHCTANIEKPENLLPEKKFESVLSDLILSEQTLQLEHGQGISEQTKFVLAKHETSAKEFSESYKYYVLSLKLEAILDNCKRKIAEENPVVQKQIDKNKVENFSTN